MIDLNWVTDTALPSLAVVALVVIIGLLFRLLVKLLAMHKEEREEWNKSEDRRTDKMSEAVDKLSVAVTKMEQGIRESSKKG